MCPFGDRWRRQIGYPAGIKYFDLTPTYRFLEIHRPMNVLYERGIVVKNSISQFLECNNIPILFRIQIKSFASPIKEPVYLLSILGVVILTLR